MPSRRWLVLPAGIVALVAGLLGALALNTAGLSSRQIQRTPVAVPEVDPHAVARLAHALTIRTLSTGDEAERTAAFETFQRYLRAEYPAMYGALDVHLDAGLTVHATWRGSNPSLPHLVMLAHQDVVPVEDPASWTHPPFAGFRDDTYIWGRGAIDDKGSLIAWHQAVEALVTEGFAPERTVHFVFSHDEELGGTGAQAVSAELVAAGTPVEAIYDEGLIIADGLVPGVPGKVGLIGIVERGYLSLELVAKGADGHASMPPPGGDTAVAVLARALTRLEDDPLPPSLEGPADAMFDWIAPEMQGIERVVFANRWLLAPVIVGQMKAKASTNASLRTTVAPTMLRASSQENVLPHEAAATLNFRLHPRDSVASITAWVTATVDDPRVSVRVVGLANEPSRMASTDSRAFQALQAAYAEVYPGMPVAPGLFVAATDSRWMQALTDDIYRFQPVPTTAADLGRIHGVDERIGIQDFGAMIVLYERLLRAAAAR